MITIRPFQEKDRERVQALCIANAKIDEADEALKQYILLMYCNYYIEQEPENCFVAVNDDDEVIGYTYCAENCDIYEQKFSEIYLPQAFALSLKYYIDAKLDIITHTMFRNQYPAHLHIDIFDEYQGQGIGSKLLDTLKQHLMGKGVRSLMLVCGSDNDGAIRFYERNGYEQLITTHLGTALGIVF